MIQPDALTGYVVADSRGDVPFRDRESFEAAMAGADATAEAVEISRYECDGEDGPQRAVLCRVNGGRDWLRVREIVRARVRSLYMHGDCWHLALALHRLYGLEPVAVVNRHPDGSESVSHVGASLPGAGFVDVRGVHADEDAFCREGTNWHDFHVRASSRDEIMAILDGYARSEGDAPLDWDNPAAYPFAAEAELAASLLLGEDVRGHVPPPASAARP